MQPYQLKQNEQKPASRWIFRKPGQQEYVRALKDALGVSEEIARLLVLRGVETFDEARTFFRPQTDLLYDPFLMKDMEDAAARLAAAVSTGEKVLVYGDYDVDGITSTTLVYLFLKQFDIDVDYYIPHRFKEGYGINPEGVKYAAGNDVTLIVSVDCGITAVEEAKMAADLGIDLIICDHHTVGDTIPDAIAVLDPKREDCGYPFDGLSGAGVAYKLIQGTLTRLGLAPEIAHELLDLVALSIASDIVPVVDENRILMGQGLALINSVPRAGIRALLEKANLEPGGISLTTIVFSLGPRINAAGRMGDASLAVKLLITNDDREAAGYSNELESVNNKRRGVDKKTMVEAEEMLKREYDVENLASMVLHHPEWHPGVIGIVASRLVDAYARPAIMLSTVDGKIKGSARSVKGFNMYDALKKCEDLLEQFGGHEFAAGLTMDEANLEEFRHRMNEIADRMLTENDFQRELVIDAGIELNEVTLKFWKILKQFEPYGPGNQRPVFSSSGIKVHGEPAIVGKGHLKFRLSQNGSNVFDAIGFNMHEFLPLLRNRNGDKIDIAYELEENFWSNRRSLQIRLRDIRLNAERES